MTESKNENDHFDLDHFDHIFWKCTQRNRPYCVIYENNRQSTVAYAVILLDIADNSDVK